MICSILVSVGIASAQLHHVVRAIGPSDSVVVLPDNFPDFSSLKIRVDSSFDLHAVRDYTIDTLHREVVLSRDLRALLFPNNATISAKHTLDLRYRALPFDLKQSYTLHSLERAELSDSLLALLDSTHHPIERIATTEPATERMDVLRNFQKSGSISRGFQVGSNSDLNLTSGFNLQFSGDLADDVTVTGALTEETSPIQPEGTTQTIQDVDKVFITVKAGDHFNATLGDFVLDLNSPTDPSRHFQSPATLGITTGRDAEFRAFNQSTFDVLSRKLLGAEASATFKNGSFLVSGASARGKYNSTTIQGQEAYQGPYRLSGANGETAIIIIAGTEHVYVDGVLQTRGEQNDYVIDYSQSEIVFQPRRLITSDSRITVDFEYSDEQYSRSLLALNGKTSLFSDRFHFSATYLREGDNQDAPLDLSLSDSDKTILANAGSDPLRATKPGVQNVGRDPNGVAKGTYVRIDTLIGAQNATYYRYAPGDTLRAVYSVTFGYTGAGKGAYQRIGIGDFQYVGSGLGDYDTNAYLPLPELNQVIAFNSNLRISQNFGITGEFAESTFDPNRFAPLTSYSDNAYRVGLLYADTLGALGYTELRGTQRRIGSQFTPLDRIEEVELQRRYGNDAESNGSSFVTPSGELQRDISLLYRPYARLTFEGGYGSLDRDEAFFHSKRLYGTAELQEDSTFFPAATLSIERIPTQDSSTHESALWNRALGGLSKTFIISKQPITLGVRAGEESKASNLFAETQQPIDSLIGTSFSYRSINPFLQATLSNHLSLTNDFTYRTDDSARDGVMERVSSSRTNHLSAAIQNLGGFSSTIDLTLRTKHYLDSVVYRLNGGDESTLLLRWEPRYNLINRGFSAEGLYEISNQRAAKLERVFLPVQKGLGNYQYLGDSNHNGRADAEEFALARYSDQGQFILITVPTEQLFPTTDLRSSARVRIAPKDLFGINDSMGFVAQSFGALSSETYGKIEETSRDENPSDIYFFRLSHFRNDSTTVRGLSEFEEDVNVLENDPSQSYRIHYLERRNAAQFNTGLERTLQIERSIRARFRPSFEVSNETTLSSISDAATSDTLSVTQPHNTSTLGGVTDWSYHKTGSAFDFGAKLEFSKGIEHSTTPELIALTNAATLRSSYAIETRARIRAEVERDELTIRGNPDPLLSLPYSLTNGRTLGITWLWKLAVDYQFGTGIVATLSYDGRNSLASTFGNSNVRTTVHNARAEVRANF